MTVRMTEQVYLVLLALADEPRHGYGIVGAVTELSEGGTRLGPGTLYGILDRLTAGGWIASAGEEVVDGRLRRYYRLTDAGTAAATRETARLRALARAAGTRLAARPALGTA